MYSLSLAAQRLNPLDLSIFSLHLAAIPVALPLSLIFVCLVFSRPVSCVNTEAVCSTSTNKNKNKSI